MASTLKVLILLMSSFFVLAIIYFLINRKINERASLLWIIGSLVIMVLAFVPNLLEVLAHYAAVNYPPALLFLFSNFVILLLVLFQSIQISALQSRCQELVQNLSIIKSTGIPAADNCPKAEDSRVFTNYLASEEEKTELIG